MWPGPFDHHLDVVFPGLARQLAQRLQLRELRFVAGIGHAAGAQTVAQREADVVLLEDLANVLEALVQHVLLVILHHPFGQDGAAAADDAGDPPGGQRNVLHQHAGVDGHVIHALLGLLFDHLQHHLPVQVLHAAHARERFVNRHRADGHGRSLNDGFADGRDIAAGGEIHHRIGAVLHRVAQLFQFPVDVRGDRRVADIGVDLAPGGDADAHRLQVGVIDVGGNDHPSARHFGADQFRREALARGDVVHLLRDDALPGIVHLRANAIVLTFIYPVCAHEGSSGGIWGFGIRDWR